MVQAEIRRRRRAMLGLPKRSPWWSTYRPSLLDMRLERTPLPPGCSKLRLCHAFFRGTCRRWSDRRKLVPVLATDFQKKSKPIFRSGPTRKIELSCFDFEPGGGGAFQLHISPL
ncbi:unnamed protein product [Amoebophrya sp. A120]|nr:unnamed protein product [Amoebophrya sp. A120]|eukprot:GSA120T00024839001.1